VLSFCPWGRDDPDPLAAFRVGHVQDHALAHAQQVDALVAVVLAVIEPLDSKAIAKCLDCMMEGDAIVAPIGWFSVTLSRSTPGEEAAVFVRKMLS
jgi:hypothetical protein